MIWLFHFLIVTFLLILSKVFKKEKLFIYGSFIYAVFIFGQRWMTGTDFPYYLRYYLIDFSNVEPGYYFIQKILTDGKYYFGILIFIVLLITLYNNYKFIIKFKKHTAFMIYLFLISEIFFAQLSQIRQFLAVSFFLNSMFYMYDNKKFKSALCIVGGMLFHDSIVFLIPFLFIKIDMNRVKVLYFLLLSSVLPLLNISVLLNLSIFDRYSHYIGSIFDTRLSIFHYIKFYVIILIVMYFVWNIKSFGDKTVDKLILNGLVFNFLLYGLSFQFAILLRVSMYFKIFEIIFLVYYFKKLRHHSNLITSTVISFLFIGIFGGLALTDPYDVSDYQFSPLRLYETRSESQLRAEMDKFIHGR